MPKFNVQQSIQIDAPLSEIRAILADFHQWPMWSPWLCAEPDCNLTYTGSAHSQGHGFAWEGDVVGSGSMQLGQLSDTTLDMDLTFLKPWKSKADVSFELESLDSNKTQVRWLMQSQLPFFMFFMTSTFTAMIGADYRRGLMMLKEYAETGSVASNNAFDGIIKIDQANYAGISGSAAIAKVGAAIRDTMPSLKSRAIANPAPDKIQYLTIYNKVNIKLQQCTFTSAVIVDENSNLENLTQDQTNNKNHQVKLTTGTIQSAQAFKVTHTGSYENLGNGWSSAMAHVRARKLKQDKNNPPFERYINDPASTPAEQLITEIFIPLK